MRDKNFITGKEAEKAEEAKRRDERLRRRDLDDVRWVLSDPRGRRFMWRIMSKAGVFRTPYAPKDTNQTHVNIGMHMFGLILVADITEADASAIFKMQGEFVSERNKDKGKQKEEDDDA